MLLKLIVGCVVQGRPGLAVGDVFEEENPSRASYLLSLGVAEVVSDAASPVADVVQNREPVIENRDPVIEEMPARKSSSRKPAK